MPSGLRREIERVVARSVHFRRREPYTLSSYVIDAVRAKLDHAERSRRPRRRKRRKVYLQL
jgi:hypothetical protein